MVVLDIKIGSELTHLKRGGRYTVLAQIAASLDVLDNSIGSVHLRRGEIIFCPPDAIYREGWQGFTVQIDAGTRASTTGLWVIYRSEEGDKAGKLYARPATEFTSNRFEPIHANDRHDA